MEDKKYSTDMEDLERETRMDFFRGGGPGGQNKNKVETGVRLSHPSGIVVEADKERTQGRNRKRAFERLRDLLIERQRPKILRRRTKVPRAEKEKRLTEKKKRSSQLQSREISKTE